MAAQILEAACRYIKVTITRSADALEFFSAAFSFFRLSSRERIQIPNRKLLSIDKGRQRATKSRYAVKTITPAPVKQNFTVSDQDFLSTHKLCTFAERELDQLLIHGSGAVAAFAKSVDTAMLPSGAFLAS
jgi:hypothetical protein